MRVEKIRVGIIGAGRMAHWHLKGYKKIPNVEVVGIAGQTKNNVEKLQKKFGISNGFDDYKKLLAVQRPDAVSITTPTHTHCTIAIDCLDAGAHVLCEKPLAMTINEADIMIEAEKRNGKILMPGFSQRFYKEFVEIKKIVDAGQLGNIRVAWFRRGINIPPQKWYSKQGESSGVTCELAIHAIDWLRWVIGSPVIEISAECTESIESPGIDDNVWILLKFKNGAIGVVGASYGFPFLKRDIGIIGDKMALSVERSKVVLERYGKHSLANMVFKYVQHSFIIPYWLNYSPFEKELRYFISCVNQETVPSITSEDGRNSLAIALAALQSARLGKRIKLPL